MSEVKKQLYIINKSAGTDYQDKLEGKIVDACAAQQVECTICYTKSRGHATELASDGILQKFDAIIAVGGDGTINEVATGLIGSNVPMGILPKGSGNGLARHLGIPLKIEGALKHIFNGRVINMDTFTLNDRLSVNISGIGFDGHIANLFDAQEQRGFWGYFRLVTKEYLKYDEFRSELWLDGVQSNAQSFVIAIANSSQYGNNARISPAASVSDNLLNVVVLRKVKLATGLPFAYRMFTGTLRDGNTYSMTMNKEIIIKTEGEVAYHIDGEPRGHASVFHIRVQPNSLQMIAPA